MGKPVHFQIQLDQQQGVYYAGQWIQGNVIVNMSEPMKMRGIHLELHGGASVHWTEQETTGTGRNTITVTHTYNAEETYFNNKVILFGNAGGMFSDSTMHPAGNFLYQFQFQLPQSIPSTYEGAWGRVRYYARAVINRPWKFDHKTKQPFTVINQLDLNQIPDALLAPQGQATKTLCCCCCASGPIEVVVRLNRKGFVPGEDILVNAEVTNNTSRKVKSSKAELIQKTIFYATTKSRATSSTVALVKRGAIEGRGSDTWSAEKLHIPPLPPSGLLGCTIIDIKYMLRFVVDPSGTPYNLKVPLPVIIGTIPLQTYFNVYTTAAAEANYAGTNEGSLPYQTSGPGEGLPSPAYSDLSASPMSAQQYNRPLLPSAPPGAPPGAPWPSYRRSVFGKVNYKDKEDNEHTMGETSYAPIYSYYNWNAPAYSLPDQPKEGQDDD